MEGDADGVAELSKEHVDEIKYSAATISASHQDISYADVVAVHRLQKTDYLEANKRLSTAESSLTRYETELSYYQALCENRREQLDMLTTELHHNDAELTELRASSEAQICERQSRLAAIDAFRAAESERCSSPETALCTETTRRVAVEAALSESQTASEHALKQMEDARAALHKRDLTLANAQASSASELSNLRSRLAENEAICANERQRAVALDTEVNAELTRRSVLECELAVLRASNSELSESCTQLQLTRDILLNKAEASDAELHNRDQLLDDLRVSSKAQTEELARRLAELNALHDAERDHCSVLKIALRKEEARCAALDAELAKVTDMRASLSASLEASETSRSAYCTRMQELDAKLCEEDNMLASLRASTAAEVAELRRRVAELEAGINAERHRATLLESTLATETERSGALELKCHALQADYSTQLAKLSLLLAESQSACEAAIVKAEQLTAELRSKDNLVTSLQSISEEKVSELRGMLAIAEGSEVMQRQRCSDLQCTLSAEAERRVALAAQLTESRESHSSIVAGLTSSLAVSQASIVALQKQAADADSKVLACELTLADLRATTTSEISKLCGHVAALEAVVAAERRRAASLDADLKTDRARNAMLQDESTSLKANHTVKVSELTGLLTDAQSTCDSLLKRVEASDAALSALRISSEEQIAQMRDRLAEMETSNAAVSEHHNALASKLVTELAQSAALEAKLATTQALHTSKLEELTSALSASQSACDELSANLSLSDKALIEADSLLSSLRCSSSAEIAELRGRIAELNKALTSEGQRATDLYNDLGCEIALSSVLDSQLVATQSEYSSKLSELSALLAESQAACVVFMYAHKNWTLSFRVCDLHLRHRYLHCANSMLMLHYLRLHNKNATTLFTARFVQKANVVWPSSHKSLHRSHSLLS